MKMNLKNAVLVTMLLASSSTFANDFSQNYPAIYQYIKLMTSNALMGEIGGANMLIDVLSKNHSDEPPELKETYAEFVKQTQDEVACLQSFDDTQILSLITTRVQQKITSTDLATLNSYYASADGQYEITALAKTFEAFAAGDEKSLESTSTWLDSAQNTAQSKSIDSFHKKHKTLFTKFAKAIDVKTANQQIEAFKNSCKPKTNDY